MEIVGLGNGHQILSHIFHKFPPTKYYYARMSLGKIQKEISATTKLCVGQIVYYSLLKFSMEYGKSVAQFGPPKSAAAFSLSPSPSSSSFHPTFVVGNGGGEGAALPLNCPSIPTTYTVC
jgi:hypothetical protein